MKKEDFVNELYKTLIKSLKSSPVRTILDYNNDDLGPLDEQIAKLHPDASNLNDISVYDEVDDQKLVSYVNQTQFNSVFSSDADLTMENKYSNPYEIYYPTPEPFYDVYPPPKNHHLYNKYKNPYEQETPYKPPKTPYPKREKVTNNVLPQIEVHKPVKPMGLDFFKYRKDLMYDTKGLYRSKNGVPTSTPKAQTPISISPRLDDELDDISLTDPPSEDQPTNDKIAEEKSDFMNAGKNKKYNDKDVSKILHSLQDDVIDKAIDKVVETLKFSKKSRSITSSLLFNMMQKLKYKKINFNYTPFDTAKDYFTSYIEIGDYKIYSKGKHKTKDGAKQSASLYTICFLNIDLFRDDYKDQTWKEAYDEAIKYLKNKD